MQNEQLLSLTSINKEIGLGLSRAKLESLGFSPLAKSGNGCYYPRSWIGDIRLSLAQSLSPREQSQQLSVPEIKERLALKLAALNKPDKNIARGRTNLSAFLSQLAMSIDAGKISVSDALNEIENLSMTTMQASDEDREDLAQLVDSVLNNEAPQDADLAPRIKEARRKEGLSFGAIGHRIGKTAHWCEELYLEHLRTTGEFSKEGKEPIEWLELPTRVENALIRAKVFYIPCLMNAGWDALLRQQGIGHKALLYINDALADRGCPLLMPLSSFARHCIDQNSSASH